mmetsp:Transcript_142773/g.397705  ORF Transcript_142773/g.397705 Transcript_142773/m.397705 type:complete len:242 (-) Transcript_142773:447-1172(-)
MLYVSGAHLPALLPIYKPCNKTYIVAEMGINSLKAALDFAEVLPHSLERLHNVRRKNARSTEKFSALAAALRYVATPERCNGIDQYVRTEVVATLATEVRDRIEVGNGPNQALLIFVVIRQLLQHLALTVMGFEELKTTLVLNCLYDEPARLLLNVDELSDVLVLETCPGEVKRHERTFELRSRRPSGQPRLLGRLAPSLQQRAELRPGTLQGLGPSHGLDAELKLFAIDPDHRVLLNTRL